MDVNACRQATDCPAEKADWTTVGRRILQAAAMATAVSVSQLCEQGADAAPGNRATPVCDANETKDTDTRRAG